MLHQYIPHFFYRKTLIVCKRDECERVGGGVWVCVDKRERKGVGNRASFLLSFLTKLDHNPENITILSRTFDRHS